MLYCKRCQLPVPEVATYQELQLCIRCDWEAQCPFAERETIDFYVARTQALNEIRIAEQTLVAAWRRLLAQPGAEMFYGHTTYNEARKLDKLFIQKVLGEERIYELAAIAEQQEPRDPKPPEAAPAPISPAEHLRMIGGPAVHVPLSTAYGATLLGGGR